MDLVFVNKESGEKNIIGEDSLRESRRFDDVINGDIFKFLFDYNEANWVAVRNATHLYDNEVPEVLVKIKTINIQDNSLLVTGVGLYGV